MGTALRETDHWRVSHGDLLILFSSKVTDPLPILHYIFSPFIVSLIRITVKSLSCPCTDY